MFICMRMYITTQTHTYYIYASYPHITYQTAALEWRNKKMRRTWNYVQPDEYCQAIF